MKKLTAIFVANRDYALISSSAVLIERFISSSWQVVLAAVDDAENQALCDMGAYLVKSNEEI